jgi:hypothetical protein
MCSNTAMAAAAGREDSMAGVNQAPQILERHFLEVRCGLLDMAAALDRMERASGFADVQNDARLEKIRRGLKILASPGTDRAEQIQLLFSDEYEAGWKKD